MPEFDLIFLNKRGNENDTREWVYYRTAAATGLGIGAGDNGSTVRVCRVKWPEFTDVGEIIDTPGTVGYTSAYLNTVKLVTQWAVDHEQSILIGVRESLKPAR
jgi:hypothetical protein